MRQFNCILTNDTNNDIILILVRKENLNRSVLWNDGVTHQTKEGIIFQ